MRTIALFLCILTAMVVAAPRAGVAQGAWCVTSTAGDNCSFTTLEQCLATSRGTGASCRPSGITPAKSEEQPKKRAKKSKPG